MKRLDAEQRERLRAWQKRMIIAFSATMGFLVLIALGELVIGFSPTGAAIAFSALAVLTAFAIAIQFGQKCPHCAYRLGFQARLRVPDCCAKCGVALK